MNVEGLDSSAAAVEGSGEGGGEGGGEGRGEGRAEGSGRPQWAVNECFIGEADPSRPIDLEVSVDGGVNACM